MYRGRYLTSVDDISALLGVRARVPELGAPGRDDRDNMAIYALAFDENDEPCGCGRLFINGDNKFEIDALGVLATHRGGSIGDLLARMLLYKAVSLNASGVCALVPEGAIAFFTRYGFNENGERGQVAGAPARWLTASIDEIRLEGACAHKKSPGGCAGDCENCAGV